MKKPAVLKITFTYLAHKAASDRLQLEMLLYASVQNHEPISMLNLHITVGKDVPCEDKFKNS